MLISSDLIEGNIWNQKSKWAPCFICCYFYDTLASLSRWLHLRWRWSSSLLRWSSSSLLRWSSSLPCCSSSLPCCSSSLLCCSSSLLRCSSSLLYWSSSVWFHVSCAAVDWSDLQDGAVILGSRLFAGLSFNESLLSRKMTSCFTCPLTRELMTAICPDHLSHFTHFIDFQTAPVQCRFIIYVTTASF